MNERIGVMDLGTNTFHLLIAETSGNGFQIIRRERRPVKIGKGGINQRTILPDALGRAIACMEFFKATLAEEGVSRFLALGTSALRDAENSHEVIEAIREATDIDVQVISGQQEAEYIFYGVRSAVLLGSKPALIVDIGGGSVEFIIGSEVELFWKVSLDIGAQRMLERYHRHDPILAVEIEELRRFYAAALQPVRMAVDNFKPAVLVGSSGTFDTLSEIYCTAHAIPYRPEQPETPLTIEAFKSIHQNLIAKDRLGRMSIPGMIELRVDMIVVASCLIDYMVETFTPSAIRVSSYSLKEGVLTTLMSKK